MELIDREIKPRDRRAVRKELAELQKRNADGLLLASDVVEAAKAPESPLHSYFQWDDSAAAQEWRLMQARALIRHIEVTMPDDSTETAVPKYVSLRADRKKPGGGYRETAKVLNSAELLAELEATAKKDIDAVLSRYELLKDLCARVRRAAGINGRKAKAK